MWSPNEKVRSPKWENAESKLLAYLVLQLSMGLLMYFMQNIPLSLKMSSASAKFVRILPIYRDFSHGTHWGTSVPRSLFCGVEKSLNYTMTCVHMLQARFH